MPNLRGRTVAVAADCELAAAVARRLAREGARIVLGSPASVAIDETIAELRWEGATILWRRMDPHDPAALGELADYAETALGTLDAIVSDSALRREAAPKTPSPDLHMRRARRLIRVAAGGERHAADDFGDEDLRVTTIMAQAYGAVAVSPDSVADAVAFALMGPGEIEVGSLFLRPVARAA